MAKRNIPKTRFTDAFIEALKPEGKQYELIEPGRTGLRLRVSPAGTKSFAWMVVHNGKYQRVSLGRYPETSLARARKVLDAEKTKHRSGIAPGTASDSPKTVADLVELFYQRRILPHRTRPDIVRQVLDHDILPAIGARRLQAVTTPVIASVVDTMVGRDATSHAGKATAILKQLFAFAEARGYIDGNPAASLRKKDLGVIERQRDRWLTLDEIHTVWHTLDAMPKLSTQIKLGLKVLLLTGVRSDELRRAEWPEFDLEAKHPVWHIPEAHTKNSVAWSVPLPDLAVELLHELKSAADGNIFVVPGAVPKEPKKPRAPIGDKALARAVARMFARTGKDGAPILPMPAWSPHDLRRTLRTHLSKLGVAPHVCEKCLNHSLGSIAEIYDQHDYMKERRDALQLWADRVRRVVAGETTVVELQA